MKRRSRLVRFCLYVAPAALLILIGVESAAVPDFADARLPESAAFGGLRAEEFAVDLALARPRQRLSDSGRTWLVPAPYEVLLYTRDARTFGISYETSRQDWLLEGVRARLVRAHAHVRTDTVYAAGPEGPETLWVQTRRPEPSPDQETLWVTARRAALRYFPQEHPPDPAGGGLSVDFLGNCGVESSHGLLLAMTEGYLEIPASRRFDASDSLMLEHLRMRSRAPVRFGLPALLGRAGGVRVRGLMDTLRLVAPVRLVLDTTLATSAGGAALAAHIAGETAWIAEPSGRAWGLRSLEDTWIYTASQSAGAFDSVEVVFPGLTEAWESDLPLARLLATAPFASLGPAPRYLQVDSARLRLGPRSAPVADSTVPGLPPLLSGEGDLRLVEALGRELFALYSGWEVRAPHARLDTLALELRGPGLNAWKRATDEQLAAERLVYTFADGGLRAAGEVLCVVADSLLGGPLGDSTRIRLRGDQLDARLRHIEGEATVDSLVVRGRPLRGAGVYGEGRLQCGVARYLRGRRLEIGGTLPDGGQPFLELGPHRLSADSLHSDLASQKTRLLGAVATFLSPGAQPLPGAESLAFRVLRGEADSVWLQAESYTDWHKLRRRRSALFHPWRLDRLSSAAWAAAGEKARGTRARELVLFGRPALVRARVDALPGDSLGFDSLEVGLLTLDAARIGLDLVAGRYELTRGARPARLELAAMRLSGDSLLLDSERRVWSARGDVSARLRPSLFGASGPGAVELRCARFEAGADSAGGFRFEATPLPGEPLVFDWLGGQARLPSLAFADSVLIAGGGIALDLGAQRFSAESLYYFVQADSLVVKGDVHAVFEWQDGAWDARCESLSLRLTREQTLLGFTARGALQPAVLLGPVGPDGSRLRLWSDRLSGSRAGVPGSWTVRASRVRNAPGVSQVPFTASASDISFSERLQRVRLDGAVRVSLVHAGGATSQLDADHAEVSLDGGREPRELAMWGGLSGVAPAWEGRVEGERLDVDLLLRTGLLQGDPLRFFHQDGEVLELDEFQIDKLPPWEGL